MEVLKGHKDFFPRTFVIFFVWCRLSTRTQDSSGPEPKCVVFAHFIEA